MSPLQVLVTSLAYLISGDARIATEEKAKLLGVVGKHVTLKHITDAQLKTLCSDAFKFAGKTELEVFLTYESRRLSHDQRLCILMNLYDIAMADGHLQAGEKEILERFREAFTISESQIKPVVDMLRIKNGTRIFL